VEEKGAGLVILHITVPVNDLASLSLNRLTLKMSWDVITHFLGTWEAL
jgi:hypothetical protein